MATKKKPTQLDRIEATIGKVYEEILSGKVDTIFASMSQPTEEQAAPQPESLRPGDYTDASKEVADALTVMGWGWYDGDMKPRKFIMLAYNMKMAHVGGIYGDGSNTYLTPAEFLSRAAVTAKELGLVPVVEKWVPKVEKWVPKVGDWVVVINAHSFDGWVNGDLFQVSQVEPDTDCYPDRSRYGSICYPFPPHRLRPATEAEIAAHLAEQEARARDEKVAKLKFGVHVAHLGRECVALQPAIMNRIDIAKLNAAGQHYFENVHIDDITVIEQP